MTKKEQVAEIKERLMVLHTLEKERGIILKQLKLLIEELMEVCYGSCD